MQGTVFDFDPATASGSVVLDDGVRLRFEADALHGVGLLHLRQGQRVHLEVEGSAVRRVSIMAR